MNQEVRKAANLRVLQRLNNTIVDILGNASHVVVYEFVTQKWNKLDVEGSLFLCLTNAEEYQLIILNRSTSSRAADNFIVNVTSSFQTQLKEPYLIFRDASSTTTNGAAAAGLIRGIWFHDALERQSFSKLLQESIQRLNNSVPARRPVNTSASNVVDSKSFVSVRSTTTATTTTQSQQEQPRIDTVKTNMLQHLLNPLTVSDLESSSKMNNNNSNQGNGQNDDDQLKEGDSSPVLLDKKTLQLTLLSLLQDDQFVDTIHKHYLKCAKARGIVSAKK